MSDLLIKGMEMPKCCDACPFSYWSNLHQTGACDLLDGEQCFDEYSTDYRTKRSEHCPLIEVPEPHGRLIDANAMFKDICDSINEMTAIGVAVDGQWLWDKLNDALKNATTIIPASGKE